MGLFGMTADEIPTAQHFTLGDSMIETLELIRQTLWELGFEPSSHLFVSVSKEDKWENWTHYKHNISCGFQLAVSKNPKYDMFWCASRHTIRDSIRSSTLEQFKADIIVLLLEGN